MTLRRQRAPHKDSVAWGWVGTQASVAADITDEMRMLAAGLSRPPSCINRFAPVEDGQEERVVTHDCSAKLCKSNPTCLNWLGQDAWQDADAARDAFLEAARLGRNPHLDAREPDMPVGLRNLGATCYANAFIQVWFQDLAFRAGVYQCKPPENNLEDSPIFQLQVTFAALQESTQAVFNPVKLVESLKLRATEQQDAQEFSKLFLSHLATEFGKQPVPALKSLVSDQFEGKLIYGTMCKTCNNRSERSSDFLELEIHLKPNCKLEDRIAALLQSENLTGDNKYACSHCDAHQDAVRYTKLQSLPPVLHFSLLRFVFDTRTLTRAKSKAAVMFPPTIDMGPFLCDDSKDVPDSGAGACNRDVGEHVYELRGVLLHKGASAYRGHYEAQVLEPVNGKWFQCNDETVTSVKGMLEKKPASSVGLSSKQEEEEEEQPTLEQDGIEVQEIRSKASGAKKRGRVQDSDDEKLENAKRKRAKSTDAPMKKRVTESSDDDIQFLGTTAPSKTGKEVAGRSAQGEYITSRDAYMLIYARRHAVEPTQSSLTTPTTPQAVVDLQARRTVIPEPPGLAMQKVKELNAAHDLACEEYDTRRKAAEASFLDVRAAKQAIFRAWHISNLDQPSVIIAREALVAWQKRGLEASPAAKTDNDDSAGNVTISRSSSEAPSTLADDGEPMAVDISEDSSVPEAIDNLSIACWHGKLDPAKAGEFKRIREDMYQCLVLSTKIKFVPLFTPNDVCRDCVESLFCEKLYVQEHPKQVAEFEERCLRGDKDSLTKLWISKNWYKDWKLKIPRMHVTGEADPPPDHEDFASDVVCEHNQLTYHDTHRKAIPCVAADLLKLLFPTWQPIDADLERCPVCEAAISESKSGKLERRKQAEQEKAAFQNLFMRCGQGHWDLTHDVAYAIVPSTFLSAWYSWLKQPATESRPTLLDTSQFICEHDKLNIDPNECADLASKAEFILMSEWEAFIALNYTASGRILKVTRQLNANQEPYLSHDDVCEPCREERNNWTSGHIIIRELSAEDPLPSPASYEASSSGRGTIVDTDPRDASSTARGRKNGLRQNVGRTRRGGRQHRIAIQKHALLKTLRVEITQTTRIPIIQQRLFLRGVELLDSQRTLGECNITPGCTLDLREEQERDDDAAWGSDVDIPKVTKRQPVEGRAFGGTLLGAGGLTTSLIANKPVQPSASPGSSTAVETDTAEISCPKCTLLHEPTALECVACAATLPAAR